MTAPRPERAVVLVARTVHDDASIAAALEPLDAATRRLVRCAVPADVPVPASGVDDVEAMWIVRLTDACTVDDVRAATDGIEGHLVTTHERWPASGDHVVPEHRFAFVHRRAGLDPLAFAAAWEVHAALVRVHQPAVAAYSQHLVADRWHAPAAYDGIAEFGYRTAAGGPLPRFATPEAEAILAADIAGFLAPGGSRRVWASDAPPGAVG